MIRRNALGAIEPRIRCYFIRKENGKWKILKNEGWYVTDVSLNKILGLKLSHLTVWCKHTHG